MLVNHYWGCSGFSPCEFLLLFFTCFKEFLRKSLHLMLTCDPHASNLWYHEKCLAHMRSIISKSINFVTDLTLHIIYDDDVNDDKKGSVFA